MGVIWGLIWGIMEKKMETTIMGCQNHGPFLDPYSNTAPNI